MLLAAMYVHLGVQAFERDEVVGGRLCGYDILSAENMPNVLDSGIVCRRVYDKVDIAVV